jgi:hypothetical protein
MDADRRLLGRSRTQVVPLASLPMPQRRLVSALLEAAKAAAIHHDVATDTSAFAPMVIDLGHRRDPRP